MPHAIVIGASVSGLLAAAALADSHDRITVLDRDTLPAGPRHRRGSAQSRHTHALLTGGRTAMERLLPGLVSELIERGALPGDVQDDCLWVNDGMPLAPGRSGLIGLVLSRPLLEDQTRRRVMALNGVEIRAEQPVTGLLGRDGRVTGVRLGSAELTADLVVDASGRGSRTPVWLGELGCAAPEEDRLDIDVTYTTRMFRRRAGQLGGRRAAVIAPTREIRRGGFALAVEGDRWMVTLSAYHGRIPPGEPTEFTAFAESLATPDIHELVGSAEPIGGAHSYRVPATRRRRYERMARLPHGLLALGDAVCALNPRYGQGMSVAAMQALALRDWARHGEVRPQRFFRRIAKIIDGAWQITVAGDLRFPEIAGPRTARLRLMHAYLDRYQAAAATDPALARRFLRVANLMDSPATLLRPGALARVLRHTPAGA